MYFMGLKASTDPNRGFSENCVAMYYSAIGFWVDIECDYAAKGVCEYVLA